MAYSNAVYYIDLENGSDSARTALTSVAVANNGSGLVRCTKAAHGLVTGAVVDVTLNYAGAWKITVIDANNFDLIGSTYSTATAVTVTPRGGSSKADAWKTAPSSARIAAGDTNRIMASMDETLIGSAAWVQYSKTVTLASAVTATICDCSNGLSWGMGINVSRLTDSASFKEGSASVKIMVGASFTSGLIAYFATGTLDLSGYQQVSFWVRANVTVAANFLSLRLCTDTAGVTSVHTIAIPALPANNTWVPVTVDLGTNLNSAIASVALYGDLDPGLSEISLDNIIACKASASADSLSLTSLIGKVWNLVWVASITYAVNDIRKPSQPNRNGYRYKVTAQTGASGSSEPTWPQEIGVSIMDGGVTWICEGLEDTWYPIQSISGTVVKIDNAVNTLGNAGRGYSGATETVATYKREPIKIAMGGNSGTGLALNFSSASGTAAARILYSGGWDRTAMAIQSGETWFSHQNGFGTAFGSYPNTANFITIENVNAVRSFYGADMNAGISAWIKNCHLVGTSHYGLNLGTLMRGFKYVGVLCHNNGDYGLYEAGSMVYGTIDRMGCNGNLDRGLYFSSTIDQRVGLRNITALNNANYGVVLGSGTGNVAPTFYNLTTANNGTNGFYSASVNATLVNPVLADSTPYATPNTQGVYLWIQKYGGTADAHLIVTDSGTIISATDQRHTVSGISWKFRPTNVARGEQYPLWLSIAKIACTAYTSVNIQVWTRRDNTNIVGTLKVLGGQIAGIPNDVAINCSPTINTWVLSSTLTVVPTEAGVIEVVFECYDGVGTTNNLWCDDIQIS